MDGDLRKLFSTRMKSAQWTPIETGTTSQGVPDSEYCFSGGRQGHVEHKRTLAWAVVMRPEQIGWLLRRSRLGGRCFVAVRRINRGDDELWLFAGVDAAKVGAGGLRAVDPLLLCTGGPDRWDWAAVERVLRGA